MKRLLLGCAFVVVGCSSSNFEVEDASVEDSSTTTETSADSSPVLDSMVDDVTTTDGASEATVDAPIDAGPPCSTLDKPNPSAVFVSVGAGNDGTGDGSALAPVKTIAKGVLLAKAKAAPVIVLDQGTYPEPVQLVDLDNGLVVQGGWKRVGAVWTHVCDAGARDLTLVQSPAAVGVYVQNAKKRSGLEHLTVATRATAEAGQTLIGVAVRGQSLFYLDDVVVLASKGGDGAPTPGTGTPAAPTCNGITGCTTAGLTGLAGAPGGAVAGTFFIDGYKAGDGNDGIVGGNGSNGTPGSTGASSAANECNWGCSGSSGCDSGLKTTVVGGTGTCGCGGVGGPSGKGGRGGGASLGLFVHGAMAVVDVTRSNLTASDGGAGQNGGVGAAPSAPTSGFAGDPKPCNYSGCTGTVSACYYAGTPKSIAGGAAGGTGRPGGKGGDGAGGAGGPSYALVQVAGGTATVDGPSKLSHGNGGAAGSGAAAGDAANRKTVP